MPKFAERESQFLISIGQIDKIDDKVTFARQKLLRNPRFFFELLGDFAEPDINRLDKVFPNLSKGYHVPIFDQPGKEVLNLLLFYGQNSQRLHSFTGRVLPNLYQRYGKPSLGRKIVDARDFMAEEVLKDKKRRSGEPAIHHVNRGLLQFLVASLIAQRNNPDITLRPFEEDNIALKAAADMAFVLHDLEEDYGVQRLGEEQGYRVEVSDKSIVILRGNKERHRTTFDDKNLAVYTRQLITAYTWLKFSTQPALVQMDTLLQVIQLLEIADRTGPIGRLPYLLGVVGKWADRVENLRTYLRGKRSQRANKYQETLTLFAAVDLLAWTWQYADSVNQNARALEFPPSLEYESLIRLLGASLNELYLPEVLAYKVMQVDLKRKAVKHLVIPDPLHPVVLTERGKLIPLPLSR